MTFVKTLCGATALALTLSTAAQAEGPNADTVVASVGDTDITLGQMIVARSRLPQQFQSLPPEVLFNGIVDQLIQQQLLADAAGDVTAEIATIVAHEQRSLLAGSFMDEITATDVTEEALQEAYDARFADIDSEEEYNASHLLVETAEEAEAAKARIDAGEDFAEVARDVSTGPSGPNGGNLGWFGKGQMVAPFEEAVLSMEAGDVVGPVETQFGFHVITLNEKRKQAAPAFEDVRAQLFSEVQEAAIQERLTALEANTTVTRPAPGAFDPEIISTFDLFEN